jgi:long-chain acyl-CoA synthetase
MEIKRTFDLLDRYKALFITREDVLCGKQMGEWKRYSAEKYIRYSYTFSYGLLELGLKKGDKILTVSNNRPEWNFANMGMSMIGVIHVSAFTSLSKDDYQYIIDHSEAKLIFVSDKKLYALVNDAVNALNQPVGIYSFDEIEGVKNWKRIIETGESVSHKYSQVVETLKSSILPDDFASLIYTSGTTGKSKGVILTHRNLVSNFLVGAKVFNLKPEDRFLSILPQCHVGGILGNYLTQYSGASIWYAENMGSIGLNMAEVKPDIFDAVPRVLEKFFNAIISKGNKLDGMKKKIFFWAVGLGMKYKPFGENGLLYEIKLKIADLLIFSKWRQALGGKVRIAGCGGARLQSRLERVFWAAGIKVLNLYGLTETSPIIAVNRTEKGKFRLGSAGMVIEDVEVKIAEDGEILCKGPNVTPGYYKDAELTKQAFDSEGWFHTGDMGYLDEGKFLMITDRKKEIFKLSNGKFIAPQIIENIFKELPGIDQIMVIGENEKFASALISPDLKFFDEWKKSGKISFSDIRELIQLPEVHSFFTSEINNLNKKLSPFENIKRFRLVPDEWTPATGELSPTLKLKRQFIHDKYKALISQIYMKQP